MVLILDGSSEIGAHVRMSLCYLICLRHSIENWVNKVSQYDLCLAKHAMNNNINIVKGTLSRILQLDQEKIPCTISTLVTVKLK